MSLNKFDCNNKDTFEYLYDLQLNNGNMIERGPFKYSTSQYWLDDVFGMQY